MSKDYTNTTLNSIASSHTSSISISGGGSYPSTGPIWTTIAAPTTTSASTYYPSPPPAAPIKGTIIKGNTFKVKSGEETEIAAGVTLKHSPPQLLIDGSATDVEISDNQFTVEVIDGQEKIDELERDNEALHIQLHEFQDENDELMFERSLLEERMLELAEYLGNTSMPGGPSADHRIVYLRSLIKRQRQEIRDAMRDYHDRKNGS